MELEVIFPECLKRVRYKASHLGSCSIPVGLTEENIDQGVGQPDHPADDVTDDGHPGEPLGPGVDLHQYGGWESADEEDHQDDGDHDADPQLLPLQLPLLLSDQLVQLEDGGGLQSVADVELCRSSSV